MGHDRRRLGFLEGPRWHDGRLWFSSFTEKQVFVVDDGQARPVVTVAAQPSGQGWLPDGTHLVVSMLDRRVVRVDADGTVTTHADLSHVATWHANDMVVASTGVAYVGNFGFDLFDGSADDLGTRIKPASLALVRSDGMVEVAATDLIFPNGSVITPDGSTLIVGETLAARYTAFTIGSDGSLGERREWAATPGMAPDGCCLDEAGGIWFSDAFGQQLVRVIEGGEVTDRLATPATSYACMLGGDDRRTLFACVAGSVDAHEAAGTGAVIATRVDIAGAGWP